MSTDDQRYFDKVAVELERNELKLGLWARVIAESGADNASARSAYIRARVLELKAEAHPSRWSPERRDRVTKARQKAIIAAIKFGAVLFAIVVFFLVLKFGAIP